MDPIDKFEQQKRERIAGYAEQAKFKQLSRDWSAESFRQMYMYNFTWMGRPIIQNPIDMVGLQELIFAVKPDLIVETGIAHGGSIIFSASMLELLGHGEVVAIDIDIRAHNRAEIEAHPMYKRVTLLEGSSIDPTIINQVREYVEGKTRVLVILDSNHTHDHVLAELRAYAPLVTPGSYCLVYDTFIEDLPSECSDDRPWGHGDNPKTALHAYLKENLDFEIDKDMENKLMITVAPRRLPQADKVVADKAVMQKIADSLNTGKFQAAEKQVLRALKKEPDSFTLNNILGGIYVRTNEFNKAIKAIERALKINDQDAELHNGLGSCYVYKKRYAKAVKEFQRAIALSPKPLYFMHLGMAQASQNNDEAAESALREHLARSPCTLSRHVYGEFLRSRGRYQEAEAILLEAERHMLVNEEALKQQVYRSMLTLYLDWVHFDGIYDAHEKVLSVEPYPVLFSSHLFHLNYRAELSDDELFNFYRRYDTEYAVPETQRHNYDAATYQRGDKLRVGFVSADFRDCSMARFLLNFFDHLDRSRVEISLFSVDARNLAELMKGARHTDQLAELRDLRLQIEKTPERRRFKQLADRWRDVTTLDPNGLAERIRKDKIDVLIDLSSHTSGERLQAMSLRPAPVQVTWMGTGYTTGLGAIDYFVGDELFTPIGCEAFYSEKIYRLDRPCFVYKPWDHMPEPGALPALQNGYITFGCFARAIRFNNEVLSCWAKLLRCLPNARLVLNTDYFDSEWNCDYFRQRFANVGGEPERLALISTHAPETWEEYQKIDIALDPFPHNAGTTTFDALWMGVPVLSLKGRISIKRFGAEILTPLGMEEWLVDSPEQYLERGAALAGNLDQLAQLRSELRGRMAASAFLDYPNFARAMEAAWQDMFERFLAPQTAATHSKSNAG